MTTRALARSGLLILAGVLVAGVASCTGHHPAGGSDAAGLPAAQPSVSAAAPQLSGCPVTMPTPVPSSESWRALLFGADSAYGNGRLWVGGLGPGGVIQADQFIGADGSIGIKFGWWRSASARGMLSISGRRLDAPGAPVQGDVPTGYGEEGFQSSGVQFPTPGCWEITGRSGATTLTFVTLISTAHGT